MFKMDDTDVTDENNDTAKAEDDSPNPATTADPTKETEIPIIKSNYEYVSWASLLVFLRCRWACPVSK